MDQFSRQTIFRPTVTRHFQTQDVTGANWWTGYESFLEPSATRRDTFGLHLSRTHIKFGMPNPMGDTSKAFWWVDQDVPSPATASANLRFAGIGSSLDVSFDSGVAWQPAQVQAASRPSTDDHVLLDANPRRHHQRFLPRH